MYMPEPQSIMIVDDCDSVCRTLKTELEALRIFNRVETESNPLMAINRIMLEQPNVLLLDLIMPSIDGEEILEQLHQKCPFPMGIIVISAFDSPKAVQRCMAHGAHYFMMKPVDPRLLAKKILQVYCDTCSEEDCDLPPPADKLIGSPIAPPEKPNDGISSFITKALLRSGINLKLKGFYYLKDCIHYIYTYYNELSALTKVVYPHIAKLYDTQPEKVERSIRTALERAFSDSENRHFYEMFALPSAKKSSGKHPSNREFIYAIVLYLKDNYTDAPSYVK